MIRSKKGNIATFIMENFGLILGAIVILGLFLIATSIYNVIFSNSQGTKESFNDLASTARDMMDTNGDMTREQAYYLKQTFILAGFNNDGSTVRYSPAARNPGTLKRPDICGSGACLCLCEGLEEDACMKNVLQCERINKANRFIVKGADAGKCSFGLEQAGGYYLYFAGDQKAWYDRLLWFTNRQTCVFGIRTLQLDKKGADIYVTIKG